MNYEWESLICNSIQDKKVLHVTVGEKNIKYKVRPHILYKYRKNLSLFGEKCKIGSSEFEKCDLRTELFIDLKKSLVSFKNIFEVKNFPLKNKPHLYVVCAANEYGDLTNSQDI